MTNIALNQNTDINNETLRALTLTPTAQTRTGDAAEFVTRLSPKDYMRIAILLAEKSYNEGGCPIGAVVVCNETGLILGKGHNRLVQDNDPLCHGETAAIRDAGRQDFSKTTLYTSLTPCGFMCTPSIIKLGFGKVVSGNNNGGQNAYNEIILRQSGVEFTDLPDELGIEIYEKYKAEHPELDLEDWMGIAAVEAEKNPAKKAAGGCSTGCGCGH